MYSKKDQDNLSEYSNITYTCGLNLRLSSNANFAKFVHEHYIEYIISRYKF
jgi:hypothetical protein